MTSEESSAHLDALDEAARLCRQAGDIAGAASYVLRQHIAQLEDRVLQLERELTLASLPPRPTTP